MLLNTLDRDASITILGSTGSIGESTLAVARHIENLSIFALTAKSNVTTLLSQCLEFTPRYAVLVDSQSANTLAEALRSAGCETKVLVGREALEEVASDSQVDMVMAAIVGAAGLAPTLAAAKSGKRLLLANKEALVMTGDILMDAARQNGSTLLPIDSEHNAIFQCLPTVADGYWCVTGKICR